MGRNTKDAEKTTVGLTREIGVLEDLGQPDDREVIAVTPTDFPADLTRVAVTGRQA